jgi:hypothetical protein
MPFSLTEKELLEAARAAVRELQSHEKPDKFKRYSPITERLDAAVKQMDAAERAHKKFGDNH